MISVGPTGQLVRGSVLDVNRRAFEEKLRDYDHLLYVRWNPKKRRGMGIWEIRRHPAKKSTIYQGSWNGMDFYKVDYKEIDIVNHVLDAECLNYNVLTKLKAIDTWENGGSYWVANMESAERDRKAKIAEKNKQDYLYNAKQHKRELQDLRELLRSGLNPAHLASYWK